MGLLAADEVKRRIYQYILEGRLAPDRLLPTINTMANEFNVSPKTVQKAVNALRAEGIITSKRGVGLFIQPVELRRPRGRRIGLLHPNSPDYLKGKLYPAPIIDALTQQLERAGLTLVPFCVTDRLSLMDAVRKAGFSALALFEIDNESLISDLRQLRLPMVSIDYDACRHGIPSVVFDNAYGTFVATRHLLEQGHRAIAFVRPLLRSQLNNNQSLDAVEDVRRIGYSIAMQDSGLAADVVEVENNADAWRTTAVEMLYRRKRTAAVCPSDFCAELLARHALALKACIPGELSIVGFGDHDAHFAPGRRITSISIDAERMGTSAAELLLQILKDQSSWSTRREVIAVKLARHESVQRVNSRARPNVVDAGGVVTKKRAGARSL